MRHIRRAAVTGLFAIWLAPLSAGADAPGGASFRADRPVPAQQSSAEARRDDRDGADAEHEATPAD